MAKSSGNYLQTLDGLRFFAFLLVVFRHLPAANFPGLSTLNEYGWIGVDLFFVLSAFLFFHLLEMEFEKSGRISAGKFYLRRVLRLYPLMVAFSVVMLIAYGSKDGLGIYRLLGIALAIDNLIGWFRGFSSIGYTSHLWTLSYEFQVYLVIPIAFIAYKTMPRRTFLLILLGIFLYSSVARAVMFASGARMHVTYTTPFLRPDSVLAGLALYILRPTWNVWLSIAAAVVSLAIILSLPLPWLSQAASAISYPMIAIFSASIADIALRSRAAGTLLSIRPLLFMGEISFGLYVYHLLAISFARDLLAYLAGRGLSYSASAIDFAMLLATTLVITVAMAAVSYFAFERPFLRIKKRFEVVSGR